LWIKRYGIPLALYCNWKNAFVLIKEPTDAELLKGISKPKRPFEERVRSWGIGVISANSPSPKGGLSGTVVWTGTVW
jgi:hypothetical protein